MSYNKIMIVAHPDDETIFGGTQLIEEKGWLVICVTNGDNRKRRKEFEKVMKEVHAEYEMWNYKDQWNGKFDRSRLTADLAEVLARNPVEKVVTHNLDGEYGHTQHIVLSKLLHDMVDNNLYVFALADKKLDASLLSQKKKLLHYYKSQDLKWLKKYIKYESVQQVR
ncbi:hypothetical protein PAESOLCIP111_05204 [Paenibacillus solanacearum]|uniref:PIG-L family deacetylase n=1 Tax=Paenibacillus solanacearum TaxID=2048548 RepID=A0A916NRD3_9BACL|nr:PIG-L family deacetylase [Paenibacillus solanacearum]CAG7646618.1 hypothetical protein PAESOLCIP111_05204 [Paenibacillus solanacearum]